MQSAAACRDGAVLNHLGSAHCWFIPSSPCLPTYRPCHRGHRRGPVLISLFVCVPLVLISALLPVAELLAAACPACRQLCAGSVTRGCHVPAALVKTGAQRGTRRRWWLVESPRAPSPTSAWAGRPAAHTRLSIPPALCLRRAACRGSLGLSLPHPRFLPPAGRMHACVAPSRSEAPAWTARMHGGSGSMHAPGGAAGRSL